MSHFEEAFACISESALLDQLHENANSSPPQTNMVFDNPFGVYDHFAGGQL